MTKASEAKKTAAAHAATQKLIEAAAGQKAATQEAEAIIILADAEAIRQAAVGVAEAKIMEAKAEAREKQGEAEAAVLEAEAIAQAKGVQVRSHAKAIGDTELGRANADVINMRAAAEKEKGFAEAERYNEWAGELELESEALKDKIINAFRLNKTKSKALKW